MKIFLCDFFFFSLNLSKKSILQEGSIFISVITNMLSVRAPINTLVGAAQSEGSSCATNSYTEMPIDRKLLIHVILSWATLHGEGGRMTCWLWFCDNSNTTTENKACYVGFVFFFVWGVGFFFAVVPKNALANVKKANCSIQVCDPSVMLDWLFLSGQSHWTGALSASLWFSED